MRQSASLLVAVLLAAAPALDAQRPQAPTAADTALFLRAQQLVAEGSGAHGRRLVDSVLAVAAEGSPRFAEALFWRAALSANAAAAERDYRRLSVEFPLTSRAADALVRLAQLELARGDRDQAMRHLDRLAREHPGSPALPRASYWMARVLFEAQDVARACDALATARATATPADVELRNQVEFHAKRCDSIGPAVTAQASTPPPAAPAPAPAPVPTSRAPAVRPASPRPAAPDTQQRVATAEPPRAAPVTAPVQVPPVVPVSKDIPEQEAPRPRPVAERPPRAAPARDLPAVDTVPAPRAATPAAPRTVTPAAPRTTARPATPIPAPATTPEVATPAPESAAAARFAIQVAAYDSESAATALARRLTGRGLDAYVVAGQGFHRVRVGRYATRPEATTALRGLREKGIEGYVVP